MTDRHAGYIVTLREDVREDDAEHILNALRMVAGVLSVKPVVSDYSFHIARERRDRSWEQALIDLAQRGPGQAG